MQPSSGHTKAPSGAQRRGGAGPRGGRRVAIATVLGAALLGACAQGVGVAPPGDAAKGGDVVSAFTRFPDMPLPKNAKIDLERTLVFGGGETWFGRLDLSAAHGADDMFGFFKRELPRFGWVEITSMRSKVSLLTYSRRERIAIISIQGATLGGSEFTVTVSPRGAPSAAAAPGAKGAPPKAPAN